MMLARILGELRQPEAARDPEVAARAGFLRWVLSLPPGAPVPAAATAALARVKGQAGQWPAVDMFLSCLSEAQVTETSLPARRGGARARRRG
ncbi:hypothetical protein [Marinovum sp.]|uniref:hypothetical protein n=1 Tax=Marinovum sp. TaxID=2024839 RepID=UPI003A93BF6B